MAKVFITGISGFIGRELAQQLKSLGHEVSGTSMSNRVAGSINCDLRNTSMVTDVLAESKPDVIIHSAALSSVTLGRTMDYYESNVLATENLIAAVNNLGARKRLVFISTAGVYGNQNTEVLSEDLPPLPVSHYGISKFACERMLANIQNKHDITIVRPFNILGPDQNASFIVPKLIEHFVSKSPSIRLGNLDPVRDYVDIRTTAKGIIDLTFTPESYGETVNICSGVGTSVRDLLSKLQAITGHDIEVIAAPEFTRTEEVWRLLGSTYKLNKLLKYQIESRDLTTVLKEMVNSAAVKTNG